VKRMEASGFSAVVSYFITYLNASITNMYWPRRTPVILHRLCWSAVPVANTCTSWESPDRALIQSSWGTEQYETALPSSIFVEHLTCIRLIYPSTLFHVISEPLIYIVLWLHYEPGSNVKNYLLDTHALLKKRWFSGDITHSCNLIDSSW
jgi:hypothetical protein